MMITEKVDNHFPGKKGHKRLNCAQTIAEIFKERFEFLSDDTVKQFKKMGFGKAPNGECGMLFAAKHIYMNLDRDNDIEELEAYFIEIAGTTQCKELKKRKVPFCAQCLIKTAKYVEKSLK